MLRALVALVLLSTSTAMPSTFEKQEGSVYVDELNQTYTFKLNIGGMVNV